MVCLKNNAKLFGMVEKNWGTAVRIVTCLLMILLAGKKFPGVRQLITTNFGGILIIHITVTAGSIDEGY